MAKIYSILIIFFLFFSPKFSNCQNSKIPDFIKNDLQNYIDKALEKWNIPGIAVAIVKDGEVILSNGYGILNINEKTKVDKNTLFMIASNSKAFTGTALALLEYEGKCSLNDKVTKWVPDFKMNDQWVTSHVTITDILTHQLGLKTFQGDFMYFYSDLTKQDIYQKFPKIIPEYEFRTKYGYCNAGYFWAGECIKSICGKEWYEFVDERLLKPLEMNRTKSLSINIYKEQNVAAAHTLQNGVITVFPHANIDVIAPAASICSSVEDMSHWLIAQLDSGKYKGEKVIPYEVIKNTRLPRIVENRISNKAKNGHYSLYGLGWEMQDYNGKEIISHTGGIFGFVSSVSLVPEINLGIVVLTNSDENWFYDALKSEIIDAYLGLPYGNYSDVYLNYYNTQQKKKNTNIKILEDSVLIGLKPTIELSHFAGKYTNVLYGNLEIKKEGNILQIKFEHHPDLVGKMEHLSGNRFLCKYYPGRMGTHIFPFKIEKGKVKSFSLKVADRLEYNRYEFVKVE